MLGGIFFFLWRLYNPFISSSQTFHFIYLSGENISPSQLIQKKKRTDIIFIPRGSRYCSLQAFFFLATFVIYSKLPIKHFYAK